MTYINNSNKNNKDNFNNESISGRNMSKQKCDDLYIKTSYNYNTPTKIYSLKSLISNSNSKSYGENI